MGWYSRRAQLETAGCTAHICHGLSWGYWTRAGATEPLVVQGDLGEQWLSHCWGSSRCGESTFSAPDSPRKEEHGLRAVPRMEGSSCREALWPASAKQLMLYPERWNVASLHWCVHMHMHVCMYVSVCASCWPSLCWRVAPTLSWGFCPILGAHGLMLGPPLLTSSFCGRVVHSTLEIVCPGGLSLWGTRLK